MGLGPLRALNDSPIGYPRGLKVEFLNATSATV